MHTTGERRELATPSDGYEPAALSFVGRQADATVTDPTGAVPLLPPLVRLLERMHMSAIVVTREGRIAYLNDAGRATLAGRGGLAMRGDQVVVTAPEARRKFLSALLHACDLPHIDSGLMLRTIDGTRTAQPLRIVALHRFGNVPAAPGDGAGLALLCVGPERARPPETVLLQQIFGLTGAESALMSAVAGGERLHACAARRGVSLATVRAQLRNVFVKTGASTQAELATIALSLPGLWIA